MSGLWMVMMTVVRGGIKSAVSCHCADLWVLELRGGGGYMPTERAVMAEKKGLQGEQRKE